MGAHLARLEMETVFRHLLDRLESFEVTGPVERLNSAVNGGIKHLPVRCRLAVTATVMGDADGAATVRRHRRSRCRRSASAARRSGGGYGDIEEREFARAVGQALDLGINLLRHRRGLRLRRVGGGARARARAAGATKRSSSTKFGTGYQDRPNFRDGRAERVRASIDASLQQPRHRPRRRVHRALARPCDAVRGDAWRALDDVVRDGQGALRRRSRTSPVDEIAACMKVRRVDVVQYVYEPVRPAHGARRAALLRGARRRLHGYGALAYGLLTRHAPRRRRVPARRLALEDRQVGRDGAAVRAPLRPRADRRERRGRSTTCEAIAARYGRTPAAARAALGDATPGVSTSLVGCRTVAEVDDDVGALGWTLDAPTSPRSTQIFARHGVNTVPRRVDRKEMLTMGDELAGKVAIVTGGASGIGRADGRAVRRRGRARSSSPTSNAELGEEVAAALGDAAAFQRDRRRPTPTTCRRSSTSPSRSSAGSHVMFNNAGIGELVRAASSTTTSPTSTG